ncbi:hypothetical protein [Corynebacterium sp.]|uniref:hypothetical protein n=1 Tax=Corynebacterium sp. TaxID=1720 RepID=UPI0028B11B57|nr:hypothetical protein [Corynebacterium sp.]
MKDLSKDQADAIVEKLGRRIDDVKKIDSDRARSAEVQEIGLEFYKVGAALQWSGYSDEGAA